MSGGTIPQLNGKFSLGASGLDYDISSPTHNIEAVAAGAIVFGRRPRIFRDSLQRHRRGKLVPFHRSPWRSINKGSAVLRLRALRHRARPDPGPAYAGADDHADAYGRADYVAAITEAYVAPDARADDRADQHGRCVATPRGRVCSRCCCLRRVPRYLITRLPPRPRPLPPTLVRYCCGYFFLYS